MARPKKETVEVVTVSIADLIKMPAGELTKKQLNGLKAYSEAKKVSSEIKAKIAHLEELIAKNDLKTRLEAEKQNLIIQEKHLQTLTLESY